MTSEEIEQQEQFNRMMDEYAKSMREYHEEVERNNQPILKALEEEMGSDWFADLQYIMEDGGFEGKIKIVQSPKGERQESDGEFIKWEWVNQRAVGDTGDSWSGTITVKIDKKRYLEMPFSL